MARSKLAKATASPPSTVRTTDVPPPIVVAERVVRAQSNASTAANQTQQQEQQQRNIRVPAALRRSYDFLPESLAFFLPGKSGLDESSFYAIRARAAFTDPTALFFNERGYVRNLLARASFCTVLPQCGRYPLIILGRFGEEPSSQPETLAKLAFYVPPTPAEQIAPLSFEVAEPSRVPFAISCLSAVMPKIEAEAQKLVAPNCAVGNGFVQRIRGFWRASPSEIPADENATFDMIRFRHKRSYVEGIANATVNLTFPEADAFKAKFPCAIAPLSYTTESTPTRMKKSLTCKWKKATTVENLLLFIQKVSQHESLNAYVSVLTYGQLRLTISQDLSRSSLGLLRSLLACPDAILIPDCAIPAEPDATNAWKPKMTIFRPSSPIGPAQPLPPPPPQKIRRALLIDRAVSLDVIVMMIAQLHCELVDANDAFHHSPLVFVVQWEKDKEERVKELEEKGAIFKIAGVGTMTVQITSVA